MTYHLHGNLLLSIILATLYLFHYPQCNAVILINEVNAHNPGTDNKEFIELYNTDATQVSLDEYTIVLYNGRGRIAYAIIPLLTGIVQPNGFYVVGNQRVQPNRNLTDIDGDGVNILQNGPDGVALYRGSTSMFTNGMLVTNTSLVDAIVYDASNRGRHHQGLVNVLTPGERTLHEFRGHIEGDDESMSRCGGMEPRKLSQFKLAPLTPGATNNCTYITPTEPPTTAVPQSTPALIGPDRHPDIIINEFSTEAQFVELYDGGVGEVSLNGLIVVFYSGQTSTAYASPISLDGFVTDDQGYLILGQSSSVHPAIVLPNTIASNGINAIALHFRVGDYIVDGAPLSNRNLVDVIVYAQNGGTDENDLVRLFSPGQPPLSGLTSGLSWSRCRGWNPVMPQSFRAVPPTPGIDNRCTLPSIVLNEVNALTERDDSLNEFIELFDGGAGHQSLDGIVVVAYNGKYDSAYRTYDLTGYTTNQHGFAVLGYANHSFVDIPVEMDPRRGFIQPGPDAVALHLGPVARFGQGSEPTSFNLIDAIIYGTEDDPALSLQHALLPLQPMPNELRGISDIDHSVSRCVCCRQRDASLWGVAPVSPGAMNRDCTRNETTVVETLEHYQDIMRINEIHLTRAGLSNGEYLELYDSGLGNVPLDNLAVVIYNGNGDDRSTTLLYLDSYATDNRGYFVIGSSFMTPTPDYSLSTRTTLFPGVSGGVAIYKVPKNGVPTFTSQSVVSREGLVDAMVFGDITIDFTLLEALAPDSVPVKIDAVEDDISIVRCFSSDAVDQVAFTVNQSTPSAPNICPYPPIVLNEINVRAPGDDLGEYIELSSQGKPGFPLNDLQVVFWKGNNGKSYKVINIDGHYTDANGYFMIGYEGLYSPRPDMTPFESPSNNLKNGPNAVTLHSTINGRIRENKVLNKNGLMDAVVYYMKPDSVSQGLADFFTPGMDPIMEYNQYSIRDESINRCKMDSCSMWLLAHISPKDHNYCPSNDAKMVINEVSLVAMKQYIELWDDGAGYTSLDDFVVVLYGEDNLSYWIIPLTGYITSSMGYFVMGVTSVRPLAQFPFADGFLRTRYGAIGLYRTSESGVFTESLSPSSKGLVDAIVYSDGSVHNPLSNVLTPNSIPIQSGLLQVSGQSISRCFSKELLSSHAFGIASQTPQRRNNCPVLPNDIVINEVNVDQPNDRSKEFIELYDGGVGNKRLQYLTLVLFNGHNGDRSYMTFDLDDYKTNEDGYFVIGSDRVKGDVVDIPIDTRQSSTAGGLLQDGPDAIALYRAPAGAFPHRTKATPNGLIDAIVYSTGPEDSHSLIDKLMPGHSMIQEDEEARRRDESISRCLGLQPLDSSMYSLAKPTPGQSNNCTAEDAFDTVMYINEVNIDTPGPISMEFVELYDGGKGDSSLDGLILVFFNGANQDRSYLEVDLNGERTNTTGYFIIGTSHVIPSPNIIIPDNSIQIGPDAIALYHATTRQFPRGTVATPTNLIDVVVYGPSTNQDAGLVERLAPSQVQLQESLSEDTADWSLSRCSSNQRVSMMAFNSAPPTPGDANQCSQSRSALPSDGPATQKVLTSLVINEVFFTGSYDILPVIEFIELKGPPNFPANDYTIVSMSQNRFDAMSLTNQEVGADGIITMATDNIKYLPPTPDIPVIVPPFLPRGTGAVALYRDVSGITLMFNDLSRYSDKLIDALVYSDDLSKLTNEWSSLLTPDSSSFYPSDISSRSSNVSISRCTCCATKTSSVFTLTTPTPGQENAPQCPSQTYSRTIQMRLINGAYDIWTGNTMLVAELKRQIAAGINENCRCGFNVNYLTEDTILNGSVIYQTTMLASSTNQSQLLYDSYVTYVQEVNQVEVHGAVYKVDGNCVSDCVGTPSAVKRSGGTKTRGPVIAVVSVLIIVIVIAAVVALFLLARHRNLIQYLKEFNDTTRTADGEMKIPGRCSLSHLDIFAQQFRGPSSFNQESFANPLYMSSEVGTASGRDVVTMATIPEVAAPHITIEVTDTDKDGDNKAAVIEITSNRSNGASVDYQNVAEGKEQNAKVNKEEEEEDVNQNEPDVTIATKDTAKILPGEKKKKKKVKKEKSGRDKISLEKVLKKLQHGDDGASGGGTKSGATTDLSQPKPASDEDDLSYRKYVRI